MNLGHLYNCHILQSLCVALHNIPPVNASFSSLNVDMQKQIPLLYSNPHQTYGDTLSLGART